jgi:hypothetical protein
VADDGQPEGESFAAPSGGAGGHVAAGEVVGQRGGLDGEGLDDAAAGEDRDEIGGDAERREGEGHEGA